MTLTCRGTKHKKIRERSKRCLNGKNMVLLETRKTLNYFIAHHKFSQFTKTIHLIFFLTILQSFLLPPKIPSRPQWMGDLFYSPARNHSKMWLSPYCILWIVLDFLFFIPKTTADDDDGVRHEGEPVL